MVSDIVIIEGLPSDCIECLIHNKKNNYIEYLIDYNCIVRLIAKLDDLVLGMTNCKRINNSIEIEVLINKNDNNIRSLLIEASTKKLSSLGYHDYTIRY